MKLVRSLGSAFAIACAAVGFAAPANATVTPYLSAGATCNPGTNSSSFSTGVDLQLSLCVTTTTEAVCGASFKLQAAPGQDNLFEVRSRSLPAAFNFANDTTTTFPFNLVNASTFDAGGGTPNNLPVAGPLTNQLLATITLRPLAGATAASYVINVDTAPASNFIFVEGSSPCATSPTFSAFPATTFTLNLSAAPNITSAAPNAGVVNTAYSHNFTATGAPAPTFSVSTGTLPPGLTLSSGGALTGTPTAAGTYNFSVRATNGISPDSTQVVTLVIASATQTITFAQPGGGTLPFNPTAFASGATASSGLTVSLLSNTLPVCTVSGLNITMVTQGMCSITASQAGNANFAAATSVTQTFNITPVAPGVPTSVVGSAGFQQATISFVAPTNTGGAPIAVNGYAATCTGTPTVTVNGSSSPIVIGGLTNGNNYACSVTATNTAMLTSAASATVMVTPVNIAPPSFTSGTTVPGLTVGVAMATFNIAASGGPTPTISVTGGALPAGVTFTSGGTGSGTATLTGTPTQAGTFNITLTASSATAPAATQSLTLTVAQGSQTITFAGPANQPFSTTPITLSATATSGLTVAFTSGSPTICTVSGTTLTLVTVGNCVVNANQAGNANFAAAPQVQRTFTVSQATQTITFGAQTNRQFSSSAQAISPLATASSGLPITYTSTTPAVCTVSGSSFTSVSLGTCTIAANQAGNANFAAATQATQGFQITIGSQSISFGGLPNQSLGTAPFTISAATTSGLPATFTSLTPTVCTTTGTNGATVTLLILGTCTIQASQAGNANYSPAASVNGTFNVVPPGAVSLTSSSNPVAYRAPVVLTANVQGTTPTGTITFAVSTPTGMVNICTAVPMTSARATCPVSGSLNITNPVFYTATYSGDGSNPANTVTLQQLVNVGANTLNVAVNPIQPVAGRNVELRATVTGAALTNKVSFNEAGVALPGCSAVTVTPLPGATNIGVAVCTVTAISAATHNYVVTYPHTTDSGFEQQIVTVTPLIASAPTDYSDMWWAGASENGWGVSITQHGMIQFIVLYVYDDAGKPIWYSMPGGSWNAGQTAYTGPLYQPTSAPFSLYDATQFKPGGPTGAPVGTATVTYTSASTATLTYTINGKSGTKSIVRQPYATDDGLAKLQLSDLWWAGSGENGWGLNIAQQGRVLFPIWYTYDSAGRDTWFGMPGGTWSGSVYTGDLYTAISSGWLGISYNASQFVVTKVGTMSLDFSDQSNAIMTYTVNGLTQRKVITRQPF